MTAMPHRSLFPVFLLAAAAVSGGCAAVTNPVADAIPVRRLPAEVLGRPKSDLQPIPFTLLKQKEADVYRLDKGDTLAIVADDVIAPRNTVPPISMPDMNNPQATVGFPVPVNDNGTISVPGLPPLNVKGKSLTEVEELIKDTASGKNGGPNLIVRDKARVTVQLLRKRTYSITVVREDTQPAPVQQGMGGVILGTNKRGNGYTLRLQAGENDVLRALNATGGPPGLDAKNEIIIERADPTRGTTHIPLRIYPEQQLELCEADIILNDGDVVKIESRDTSTEVFYVAGVGGSRPFTLPRDYDLNVLEALLTAGAPIANGGFTQNAFIAQSVNTGLGTPSPALLTVLRPLGNGRQIPIRVDLNLALTEPRERLRVQPGDILVMQERPGDAIVRYGTQTFRLNTAVETVRSGSFNQALTAVNP
jgi:protein involved in polysaccharide export with SLBB domain